MVEGVGKLPPGLRELHLDVHDYLDCVEHFAHHPPLLVLEQFCVSGKLPHHHGAHISTTHLARLPRNLQTLAVTCVLNDDDDVLLLSSTAAALFPPNMVRLNLCVDMPTPSADRCRPLLCAIPRTLTELSLFVTMRSEAARYIFTAKEFCAWLPPGLCSFKCNVLPFAWSETAATACANFWPTSLRELGVDFGDTGRHVFSHHPSCLPPHLTRLQWHSEECMDWSASAHHCSTSLQALSVATPCLEFAPLCRLVELRWTVGFPAHFWRTQPKKAERGVLRIGSMPTFPPTLLRLTIRTSQYDACNNDWNVLLAALPPTLQKLDTANFGSINSLCAPSYFRSMPRTLTSLSLWLNDDIAQHTRPANSEPWNYDNLAGCLPRHLRHLSIEFTTCPRDFRVSWLPTTTLTSLKLWGVDVAQSDCIDAFMPQVTRLRVQVTHPVDAYLTQRIASHFPHLHDTNDALASALKAYNMQRLCL